MLQKYNTMHADSSWALPVLAQFLAIATTGSITCRWDLLIGFYGIPLIKKNLYDIKKDDDNSMRNRANIILSILCTTLYKVHL